MPNDARCRTAQGPLEQRLDGHNSTTTQQDVELGEPVSLHAAFCRRGLRAGGLAGPTSTFGHIDCI